MVESEYWRISERLRLKWCGVPSLRTAFLEGDQKPFLWSFAGPGLPARPVQCQSGWRTRTLGASGLPLSARCTHAMRCPGAPGAELLLLLFGIVQSALAPSGAPVAIGRPHSIQRAHQRCNMIVAKQCARALPPHGSTARWRGVRLTYPVVWPPAKVLVVPKPEHVPF